ncbi:MAG: GNAT family N-acetyltransferase [Planctomycetes bacterium]|nr:GNAT family N-acetyltransferase [Planctomycetota bacterium]
MKSTTSVVPDSVASALGESLISLPTEQFGQLQAFVPDTPWTSTVMHVIQRKQGKVFVDSAVAPRNLVVIAAGDPASRTMDQAFLFGSAASDALRTFVESVKGPMEIVCDDEVAALVEKHHPDAKKRDSVIHWFARLEDTDHVRAEPGSRRLRITESDQVAPLLPGWALRTFRTPKDLVTGGTVYVVDADSRIAAAAFTVDQSAKYERVAVSTLEAMRGKGYGAKAAVKVVRAVADQGRIPCAVIDRRDAAGLRIAEKIGFNQRALSTTYVTAFRK